jgi:alpha-galactosidase
MLSTIVHVPHYETESLSSQVEETKREIKIAYIGGGSREWAVKLMADLALTDKLTGKVSLYDVDYEAAAYNKQLSQAIFSHPQAQTQFEVEAERKIENSLRGADFVVISIEPGSTCLRYADLEIPAKYGVFQTVGDTTGPGGILRALRCTPMYESIAAAIMEHCPNAWVINYTNPMSVCVSVLAKTAPQMKVFGCCHEVFGTQKRLAELVDIWFEQKGTPREDIELDIAGVNHFTWATSIHWQGQNLMPHLLEMIHEPEFFKSRAEEALAAKEKQQWFSHFGLVAYDLLRRFGALGAAGDRHLAEFVPWYLGSEEEIHRWGIVRTPYSWRLQRSLDPRPGMERYSNRDLQPSGEEGVKQIEALLGLRQLTTNVNLPNKGQIPDLPEGGVVETYAHFGRSAITPLLAGKLPTGALGLVQRAYDEQCLTTAAALERDVEKALQALLCSPLVHLSTDDALKMFKEMLSATREVLPGWKL